MDIKKSWIVQKPIAHRGLHNDIFPENSLASFSNAIEQGYPIELDVRTIDDGNIIVFHDDLLTRMTNKDGYVANLTKNDLKEITLKDSDEHIPTLQEVLELVNGKTPILIETKTGDNKVGLLEKHTLDILKEYKGEYAVQSFNPYSMEFFKKNAPHILRGQLSSFFQNGEVKGLKRYLLKRLKLISVSEPDFISYDTNALPNKYVTKTKLPVLAWTVKNNAEMLRVSQFCDNIIFQDFIPDERFKLN